MTRRNSSTILCCGSLALLIWFSTAVPAQEANVAQSPGVTAAATAEQVRFISFDQITQIRLEVFSPAGERLFDSGFKSGDLLDWGLRDQQGRRLDEGSYLCVVTVKDLAGRPSQRHGLVSLQERQVSLQRVSPENLTASVARAWADSRATQAPGAVRDSGDLIIAGADASAAMTVTTHDGKEGQLRRTRGALTFRVGDFLVKQDKEQMRLTEAGNLGIGTKQPQAKLDVNGDIRAAGVVRAQRVEFPDGTVQTTGTSGRVDLNGNVTPNVAGTGTQGRIPKWTDNAGTLGDSLLNETTQGIELRPSTAGVGVNPSIINPSAVANFSQFLFYPAQGVNVSMAFGIVPRGTGTPNNHAQFTVLGTDYLADQSNFEFVSLRARDTDFVLGTGRAGTGQTRPIMLASGFLTDNVTNNGQLVLATSGNVGVGTTSPGSRLTVAGLIQSTNGGIKFPDGTVQTTAAAAGHTSAICASAGSIGGVCVSGTCSCAQRTISSVSSPCTVTSDTGSCSANSCGGLGGITSMGMCCVCSP